MTDPNSQTLIPVDIITDEEMALIQSAFSAARSLFRSPVRSLSPVLNRKNFSIKSPSSEPDIEDFNNETLLQRYRKNRGLAVTDITSSEWCEKQMDFCLRLGKPEPTNAMKAGTSRHTELEEEVVKKVEVQITTMEDVMALKLLNFITGVNQLFFDGLTRELPLVGFVEGVWMVGIIDEIRMSITGTEVNPILVDTKTRFQATLPSEAQRRNGRLQLMCYKFLLDNIARNFPSREFFDFFSLDPKCILSEDIREVAANSGFPVKILDDLIACYLNTCSILPPAHDQLLLRYELQADRSLLHEDQFLYDENLIKEKLQYHLEFWQGKREADYTHLDERWKCRFCKFSSDCSVNSNSIHG